MRLWIDGQVRLDDETSVDRRSRLQGPAKEGGAFVHTEQAMPVLVGRS